MLGFFNGSQHFGFHFEVLFDPPGVLGAAAQITRYFAFALGAFLRFLFYPSEVQPGCPIRRDVPHVH